MYFVVCYIVLTVRGNLKMPKAKILKDPVFLFNIATHNQTIYLIWSWPCGATYIDIIMDIAYL